jgi:hypothetical protein
MGEEKAHLRRVPNISMLFASERGIMGEMRGQAALPV